MTFPMVPFPMILSDP